MYKQLGPTTFAFWEHKTVSRQTGQELAFADGSVIRCLGQEATGWFIGYGILGVAPTKGQNIEEWVPLEGTSFLIGIISKQLVTTASVEYGTAQPGYRLFECGSSLKFTPGSVEFRVVGKGVLLIRRDEESQAQNVDQGDVGANVRRHLKPLPKTFVGARTLAGVR